MKTRVRYGKRKNSIDNDNCIRQEINLPDYLLDCFQGDLSLSEMELNCELGIREWYVLIENIRLSRREQQCLIKYYWRGFTQEQIAKDSNHSMTREAVKIYLERARNKIAKYYGIDINKFNNVKKILERKNKGAI